MKWTIGPEHYEVSDGYLCLIGVFQSQPRKFRKLPNQISGTLRDSKYKITSAEKKAVSRYLNPNSHLRGKNQKLVKMDLDWLEKKIPKAIGESANKIKIEIEKIKSGESDIGSLISNIESSFGFTRGPFETSEMVYYRDSFQAKTRRQLFAEIAPGFFTVFSNPDILSLLLDTKAGSLNEIYSYAVKNGYARVRNRDIAIRDVAWFLTYGLFPNAERASDQPAESRLLKLNLDFGKGMFDNYKKFVTDRSVRIDLEIDPEVQELLDIFKKNF